MFINNDENGNAYTLSDEITFASCSLRSINPFNSPDHDFYQISNLVYDGLVELDDTLAPQPALAESWTVDREQRSVTFVLKKGIRFSDGTTLTAGDVVYSFNACRKASGSSYYDSAMSRILSASAQGDSTVVFRCGSAYNISISDFVFPIVSSDQFSSEKALLENTDDPVTGTGPYVITSADLKKELKLEANPFYYGTAPVNSISVNISPVLEQYAGFVENGEIHMIVQTSIDREDISGNSALTVTEFTSNEFETLGFNCSSGPCADASLRQAIAYLVDRDEIKRAAYYNNGIKSDDLYYPGYYGTAVSSQFMPDQEKASALLSKAGYSDSDGDGMLESSQGNELSLRLIINTDNLSRKTAADLISAQLLNSGIRVSVSEVSSESFPSVLSSGGFDLFIGGWKAAENYDLRSFYGSGGSNPAHYSNPALDQYLNAMQSGITGEEMLENLQKAKAIISDDVPYLCLLYRTYAAVSTADLQGLVAPRFNNYYYACEDWKIRVYQKEEEEDASSEEALQQ
ncbi:MAG: ABC transporter substrate-binding protein [Anaerovoracaceae bacterium]